MWCVHTYERISILRTKRNTKAQFYLRHKNSNEANLEQLFSNSRSGTITSKNQKRITAGTHFVVPLFILLEYKTTVSTTAIDDCRRSGRLVGSHSVHICEPPQPTLCCMEFGIEWLAHEFRADEFLSLPHEVVCDGNGHPLVGPAQLQAGRPDQRPSSVIGHGILAGIYLAKCRVSPSSQLLMCETTASRHGS